MRYLWLASLLWAFSFGLIKTQLAALDPLLVAALRLVLAAVAFLPWALARRPAGARVRIGALALGALQFGLMYALYIASYRYLPAYGVALWTVLTPLYVVLFADLSRRRLPIRHLAAALLAVGGAVVVVFEGSPAASPQGILLVQGANVCFALGQLGYRRLKQAATIGTAREEAGLLGWMYMGATALTVLAVLVLGNRARMHVDPDAALVLLYLGLVPTALGFALWNLGAARTNPGILAVSNNLKVPLAVLIAWLVFGEHADHLRMLLGLALLLGATVIAGPDRPRAAARP